MIAFVDSLAQFADAIVGGVVAYVAVLCRVAAIAFLVIACFLMIRPFLAAILFAAVLCLSTWPAFRWVRDRLGGRNTVAALLFVLAMLLAIALPVALAGFSLVTHSAQAIDFVKGFVPRSRCP